MYSGISERINRDHISCLNMFGFKKDKPVHRSAMTNSWYEANVSVFAFFGDKLAMRGLTKLTNHNVQLS